MSEPAIRDEFLEDEKPEQRPEYIVDNDQKADWCLRQIKEKQEELERWTEHYKMLSQQITDQINADIAYFEAQLERYFFHLMNDNFTKATKTQVTYSLPTGKLVLKHPDPEYKHDDETLIPWLEKNAPEFIKVKRSTDWDALKKTLILNGTEMITADGEVVPGITATPRPDVFKTSIPKKKEGK